MGFIYKVTCKTSKKSYIGQTVQTILQRWSDHKYEARNHKQTCRLLNQAIRLYGENDWIIETLLICDDSLLDNEEIKFIELHKTLVQRDGGGGYNLRSGGQSRGKVSEETREIMRKSAIERDSNIYRRNTYLRNYKYLIERDQGDKYGFVIHRHPLSKDVYFVSRDISKIEYNFERAITKLNQLNAQLIKINKSYECSSETKCLSVELSEHDLFIINEFINTL